MEKFELSLTKISEKEFFLAPNENLKINQKNLKLGFNFQFKWNENSNFIEVLTTVIYLYKTSKLEKELLKFKCVLEFEVGDLHETISIDKSNGNVKVPDNLAAIFIATAISTCRGMLVYKTAGTYISNFHLPLFDVNDFISMNNN